jgi:hypothetical protein
MTPDEMIRAAQDALGAGRTDDYKIQPTRHSDELAATAPALALALWKSELSVVAEEYERKHKEAIERWVACRYEVGSVP